MLLFMRVAAVAVGMAPSNLHDVSKKSGSVARAHTQIYLCTDANVCVCVCVCVCIYIYIYVYVYGVKPMDPSFWPHAKLVFKSLELFWLNRTRKGFNPIASAPRTPAHPPSRPSHPHFPPPPAPT